MRYPRLPFAEFTLPVSRVTPPRYDDQPADLVGVIARRTDRPWLLELLEPISDRAPNPSICQPHCCYIRTVIFYARPYRKGGPYPWQSKWHWHWEPFGTFAQFDKVQSRLTWDDVIACDGEHWRVDGGQVVWLRRRWWMYRELRRMQP